MSEEEALECAEFFLSKEEQILQVCKEFDLLRDKSSEFIQEFLADFFEKLKDEEEVLQTFVTMRRNVKKE